MKVSLATMGRYALALPGAFLTKVGKVIDKFTRFIASFFKARNSVSVLPRASSLKRPEISTQTDFAQKFTATVGSQTSSHSQTSAAQTSSTDVTTVATQTEDTIDSQAVVDDDLSNQLTWDESEDQLSQYVEYELNKLLAVIKKDEQRDAQDLQDLSAQAEQAQSDIDNRVATLECHIKDADEQIFNARQEAKKALQEYEQLLANNNAEEKRMLSEIEQGLEYGRTSSPS